MAREIITLECTEAKAAGMPPSRYVTTRNKKSTRTPGRLEKVKFNHHMKKRTLQPKTEERLIAFRKANRRMPRRRMDIPVDKINYKNPELLAKFTTETGKLIPRRITGVSAWIHRKITREVKRARAVNLMP